MQSGFFAMLSRMKYISRWALMRNTERENLSEHSLETAVIAHALAVLGNARFGRQVNPERVALLAVYHDVPEILTGDMPTPVKYYNPQIREAYGEVERTAGERMLSMLPEDIRESYRSLLIQEEGSLEARLVKAADKLSALIKCIEERKAGNMEFVCAQRATEQSLRAMELPEADAFLEEFIPAYSLTLDEQGNM
ncbi:MAG: 5'-deoxynucleotidase [Ruminococcaceae bacterium]|nr:5'-deoxynucleotidase [Oscillospiraceae bacterium]